MKLILIISGIIIAAIGVFYILRPDVPVSITNLPSKGTDIIAFGDSLVLGAGSTGGNDFVSLLSKKIGQPIINLGHGGDTTEDGLARINQLDDYNPKVVLLLLGGNDHLKRLPVSTTHQNLAVLIANIQSRGAVVLLLGVRGGLFVDNFKNEFKDLHTTYHTAFVADVLDGIFGDSKYMADEVHPNNAGYEKIAERIYPVLVNVIEGKI